MEVYPEREPGSRSGWLLADFQTAGLGRVPSTAWADRRCTVQSSESGGRNKGPDVLPSVRTDYHQAGVSPRGPPHVYLKRSLVPSLGLLLLSSWCAAAGASSPASWTAGLGTGAVSNVPTTLRIEQDGAPTLRMTAHYAARPLKAPFYYSAWIARGTRSGAWEVEFIHHKLYLEDTTPDVPHLEATHGYNYLLVNRAERRGGLLWRIGAGIVLVHLEGTVRGRAIHVPPGLLGSGYRLAGPSARLGAGREIGLGDRVYLLPEVKLTAAYVKVPIEGGHVTCPNVAVHAVLGLGYAL